MKTFRHKHAFRLICLLSASTLSLAAGCVYVHDSSYSYSSSDFTAVASQTRKGELPADLKILDVENHFGAVHVVATDNGPAQFTWKLTVHARTDVLASNALAVARCEPVRNGDRVQLILIPPDTADRLSYQSDLEIQIPKATALRTQNHFGATTIVGLAGDVEVEGQNGSVELRNLDGKVQAKTSFALLRVDTSGPASLKNQNGPIEAVNIHGSLDAETSFASLTARGVNGPVKLHNQNGRIEALQVKGNADLKTSFADLVAQQVEGDAALANQNGRISARDITGSVKAGTSFATLEVEGTGPSFICHDQNGSIHLRASSTDLAKIDAQTSFGTIEVSLPAGLKPAIQAHTSFAEIESDFPVLLKPKGQEVFADIEAGTPRVTLQNQNGGIRILREKATAAR
ncbi:DUF4097 family beta strand repeat-containing protein [Pedosphaera parvula]|uniref:Uncharacterized protein n=1 Tax=Pedosphaera parvula (strain Ellin514) TaxID=320771 RepID=B9XPQ8_PEDPL|nr:DUF4097 family beta strand repeat-containing protein [Pedosphaera parvula]EEF58181.1 hypothetical protein Cflav_PD1381 [Pedosphaera parvula Ellin514]